MKRLHGFSLMEMMIVLTIVAIVAAASAPMVNKKMVRAASDKSPWIFTNGESIGYNIDNDNGIQDRKTATIGANGRAPAGIAPRLYINNNSDNNPHILFGRRNGLQGHTNLVKLIAGGERNNIILSNNDQTSNNSVVIGPGTQASNFTQVVIGNNASSNCVRAVAIGNEASVRKEESIAIGASSATGKTSIAINGNAPSNNSISIGWGANAASNNSLAFGYNAKTGPGNVSGNQNGGKQIALGYGANATYYESIALGPGCAASNYRSVAIGSESKANATSSIVIGREAQTTAAANDAIAIGNGATASHFHSAAFGYKAKTTAANQIVLGDENTTVVIPGSVQFENLRVSKNAIIDGNLAVKTTVYIRTGNKGKTTGNQWVYLGTDDYKGGDDNFWKCNVPGFVSDRRLKNVGKVFESGLAQIRKLEVFNYTFKDDKDKTPRVGVMAQDLQKIFPDAVVKGEDGFLRIRMEDMFYAVINAVKELDIKYSAQEKRIKELEKQNLELIKRIEALEKRK